MKQVWTLETIFPGGSASKELDEHLEKIKKGLEDIPTLPLRDAYLTFQSLQSDLTEAYSFSGCLVSQNVDDKKAKEVDAKIESLLATAAKIRVNLDEKLKNLSETEFETLLRDPELKKIEFTLRELRRLAKKRLSADKESLIEDLSTDGYHGWGQYYDTLANSMAFPFRKEELSQGQIENRFSNADRSVRKEAFDSYVKTYEQKTDHFGELLNRISGFRLKMYEARGWKNVLMEPCDNNRLLPVTLDAMWSAVAASRKRLVPFLQRKAQMIGVEKLSWYDLDAPLGEMKSDIPYDEGAAFILKQFETVSPKLATYSKKALDSAWVESEDRKGKRSGGFCTDFPKKCETRIFMTYSNTITNIVTLAHELGHAFHADCCFSLPYFNQCYGSNVAETASNMAEIIVADAALREATDPQEKISLLNDKLTRTVAYLMNLHARFLFEQKLYEERKKGFLLSEQISNMMLDVQKETYCNQLETYHPLFWATKLHFYLTKAPFYNFPYTFGFLFSLGVYTVLMKDSKTFEKRYIALLQDTGQMTSEELALKHLGVDLKEPSFWEAAIDCATKDVDSFLELTEEIR